MQLAALAFPSDPRGLRLAPLASAVQQREPGAAARGAVSTVQCFDTGLRRAQDRVIGFGRHQRRILPIREEGEAQLLVGIGEEVDLEPLELPRERRFVAEHGRQHDEGAQFGRDALREFECGEGPHVEAGGGDVVEQHHRHVGRREQGE